MNQALRSELLQMEELDQKYRNEMAALKAPSAAGDERAAKDREELRTRQEQIDQSNMKRLEEIIREHGWPGQSLVGKEGGLAAFLIVQHAELEHQKKYLPLLRAAVAQGDAEPSFAAYLEDRILMREEKKQIYGTQLQTNPVTKKPELYPVENPQGLDARRASVGLEPIAEYLKRFGVAHQPPPK